MCACSCGSEGSHLINPNYSNVDLNITTRLLNEIVSMYDLVSRGFCEYSHGFF